MKKIIRFILFFSSLFIGLGTYAQDSRAISFDRDWRFIKDTLSGAENPSYDDRNWRLLNLPHDWSIEDLPNQNDSSILGPFTKFSVGKASTGYTEGGVGWYRKTFTLDNKFENKQIWISFEGVYMNADVWINGHYLGNHPYGYTSFNYNLTEFLNPLGKSNVIVVRTENLGRNSRWYAGSGIYRHVWLIPVGSVHTSIWGNFITTPSISKGRATIQIESTIENISAKKQTLDIQIELLNTDGKMVSNKKQSLDLPAGKDQTSIQSLNISSPVLWDLENPYLYQAKVSLILNGKILDQTTTPFGIRKIQFDGQKGFLLNGKPVKLKGGCVHHDLGPLGAASIDRAEERKVELLKQAGYNAIRLSHNPVAPAFLNACDKLGMLVLDEAFDMWENPKNQQDYHLYFKEWWQRDLESIIRRDRNHPSVIMWSIGNEIYELPDTSGYRISKDLVREVKSLDTTRPVTEAVVFLPPYTKKAWEFYEPPLTDIDVDGYNYFLDSQSIYFRRDSITVRRFDSEHAKHPEKTYMTTEYLPVAALENYEKGQTNAFYLGGFKWTAMDYIGEAGIGRPILVPESRKIPTGLMGMGLFYKDSWPVYNAYCGDLDLIGNKKAASYYQDVVWGNSPVELLVHSPIPAGMKEAIAPWGFPDEMKSWTWPGEEGKKMQVHVYTRSREVKLELNGKEISNQMLPNGTITATFEIEYQPGMLVAKTYDNGKETGSSSLSTAGKPVGLRLTPDRNSIKADLNDLCYVHVEVVDEKGNVVPNVDDLEISYSLTGNAGIAAVGNGKVDDMSSFQQHHKKVYHGKGLVIIRPSGKKGTVNLKATANGLKDGLTQIHIQ
jgi:beta-galactosidase